MEKYLGVGGGTGSHLQLASILGSPLRPLLKLMQWEGDQWRYVLLHFLHLQFSLDGIFIAVIQNIPSLPSETHFFFFSKTKEHFILSSCS